MRRADRVTIVLLGLAAGLALPATAPAAETFRFFASPWRNIGCVVSRDTARCDIVRHTWKAPRRPASCELDWGSYLTVGRTSRRGAFACVGDTARDPKAKRLALGRSIRVGTMRCSSRADGVRCANGRGHGFLVGVTAYRLF